MSRYFTYGVVTAALLTFVTPAAPQESFDKLAYLTFSAPVQVPGATLSAGTYRFHLTNAAGSRNVMQVLSNNGSTVYGMFNTVEAHRRSITDDPAVTFKETPAGVAPAIKALFYGGQLAGYEFVYPKGE
jgi:hypothetical protein